MTAEDHGDTHYGLSLLIKGDRQEDGKNLFYLIAHLSRYETGIEKCSTVSPGQIVGYVGNTGNCYTGDAPHPVKEEERAAGKGAHLHLSVYKADETQGSNLWDKTNNNFKTRKCGVVNPFNHYDPRKGEKLL